MLYVIIYVKHLVASLLIKCSFFLSIEEVDTVILKYKIQ